MVLNPIRRRREELRLTQIQLALKANLAPRTVHAIEKGAACRQYTKRKLLIALGVSWEERHEYFLRQVQQQSAVSAA